jgi:peptidoglycan hydrolase-like protein with peptidoglycan-binding domain
MFNYPKNEFVKDIRAVFNVDAAGVAGTETLMETITLSEVLNRKHPAIYFIQRRLYSLGYTEVGKINGIANTKFTNAVKHFQSDNGCVIDGEITARGKTWKKLLGME